VIPQKFAHIPRQAPELCPGCPGGSRRVGARGREDADLVILLEAPGVEELIHGIPICGPSGDLIDQVLPPDFDKDEKAFIINSMQCRGPKAKNNPQVEKEYKSRAVAACRTRVLEQVFRYPRKCVLALGGWASICLTGNHDFKITQRRGVVYTIEREGVSIPVVPAVHPAFLLRGSGNPKVFREDIDSALHIAYGTPRRSRTHRWADPNWAVINNVSQLRWLISSIKSRLVNGDPYVAADIETSGFNPFTDYMLSIGFYFKDSDDTGYLLPAERLSIPTYFRLVKTLLRIPGVRFVWQGGKFDEKFLKRRGLYSVPIVHEDTLLLSYALSEASKDHDLDEQAKNDLGAPNHKHMVSPWVRTKKDSYANVPRPVLYDYQARDLKKTLLVYDVKRPLVASDPSLEKLYTKTLLPASSFLTDLELYGIHVDWDYVRINREGAIQDDVDRGLVTSLDKEIGLEKELQVKLSELEKIAGYPVNPNAPAEVSALLYDRYGLTIKGVKPTDTRKETLEKLPSHPAVKLIRDYRSTTKMLSTYVTAIEERAIDDRIHTTYKLHVTTTGRLSSSEPNIQNIPREARFKRMYRARPGYVLIEGDYNSAELRMLAALSGDRFLTGVFLDDKRNLHDEVAVAMYGLSWTDYQRIRAKAINFGIPYGREAFSVAQEFDMPEREAQRLIDAWFARAPEAAKFLKRCRSAPSRGAALVTVFGRKRRPGVVSPERIKGLMNEFANFHMQSPISDFTIHSAMEMKGDLARWGAHTVNLIHDSILSEVPDDPEAIQAASNIVRDTMENVPTKWIKTPIRFKVDLKRGTHWGLLSKWEQDSQGVWSSPPAKPRLAA